MSSTNRSNARNSRVADYYITPVACIKQFLQEFHKEVPLDWSKLFIVNPCAGGDAKNPMSYPEAIRDMFGQSAFDRVLTVDIREDSRAKVVRDYLELEFEETDKPDLIITNPPFKDAQAIIEKSLKDVKKFGWVIMLLRLNFFGSISRKPFFEKYNPSYVYVRHRRMSFSENGKTDSIEYCHMCFQKGAHPEYTKLKVI